uniref:Uncharacterized protein n=1 Tax=Rhizophora mucronata TaxID=61149 RepID=A0A2P2N578_RHIMU
MTGKGTISTSYFFLSFPSNQYSRYPLEH